MPHQCVRCNKLYDDGAQEILKGCSCGGKLFFFIKPERLKEVQEEVSKLTKKEKKEIEEDVYDIIGNQIDRDKSIVLEFEAVRILKPGKYELDLVNLFKKEPLIIRVSEGKYIIDLVETFKNIKKN